MGLGRRDRRKGIRGYRQRENDGQVKPLPQGETQSPLFLWKQQARLYRQERKSKADLAHNFILFRI